MNTKALIRKENLQVHSMLRHVFGDSKKSRRRVRKTLEDYALYLIKNEDALKALNYYLVRERNPAMYEPDLIAKLFLAARYEFRKGGV